MPGLLEGSGAGTMMEEAKTGREAMGHREGGGGQAVGVNGSKTEA